MGLETLLSPAAGGLLQQLLLCTSCQVTCCDLVKASIFSGLTTLNSQSLLSPGLCHAACFSCTLGSDTAFMTIHSNRSACHMSLSVRTLTMLAFSCRR